MPGYTIQNLKEVEDQAPKFGMAPHLEARMARVPLELEHSGISYQRLAPGFRIPWGHTHNVQEEVYVVVNGSMRAKLDDEIVELKEWDALRVPKETMRSFEAGPEGVEILAVGAPNTGPGDANLEHDWWVD
jgi:mannose-6-phosphate isomerase-like protein (cupin superfamily)